MNIPNMLTWLRVALVPVFVIAFYLPFSWSNELTAALFALAALTDWLDGYLARRWEQVSAFGAFLDPVADKLMVAAALVLIVQANPTPWVAIPAVIIIGREIAISALREWMAEYSSRKKVKVASLGKIKTVAQMLSLLLMLLHDPLYGFLVFESGVVLLYIAAFLTLQSMFSYLRAAWPALTGEESQHPE